MMQVIFNQAASLEIYMILTSMYMKTILVATDFSSNARNAASFAYKLAKAIRADIILCNAVVVPSEVPVASAMVWPLEECENLLESSIHELNLLKNSLELADSSDTYRPAIRCTNETGTLAEMIGDVVKSQKISLTVIGTHGSSGINQFLLGNHSRELINQTLIPLLLVPADREISRIKKIAFAADFKKPEHDLISIYALIEFARPLEAEILLTYVCDNDFESPEFQHWIQTFMTELSNKANYPHIYYRIIRSKQVIMGLDWLCRHGQIDMLAMVHRSKTFMENLFRGSKTQKMAQHIPVPLLVFPSKE